MIKAYLFSNITRQINHTYYSLPDVSTGQSKFYYNLKDYRAENFLLNESFIYEVEIYPETVFICSDRYLRARKYKTVRCVRFDEYLNEVDLPADVAEELAEIFNCRNYNILKNEFYNLFNQAPGYLSPYEKLKFLAILNRTQGNFPLVPIEESYQIHYIKLFEFYRIPYNVSIKVSTQEVRRERIFGAVKFETINNQTDEIIERAKYDSSYISNLIIGRKITQKQFEKFCDLIIDKEIWIGRFFSSAIISGYKIQPQHEEQFYPFFVYHSPEKLENRIKNKLNVDKKDKLIALENNYMIEKERYWTSYQKQILKAKKIFLKDGLKIIDRS